MKRLIIILVLGVALIVGCKRQASPYGNPSAADAAKLPLTIPWTNVTVKMLIPGSSGPPVVESKIVELPAKLAAIDDKFPVLAMDDPYTKKTYVLFGSASIPKKISPNEGSFYISQDSGPVYCNVGPGNLNFGTIYIELPMSSGSLSAAIAQFEKEFDVGKLSDVAKQIFFSHWLDLRSAVTNYFFSEAPAPGGSLLVPDVESRDLTDGILRLSVRNPKTKIPATFWIDLKARKVIESVVDGQQMDLSTGKPFAVPLGQR
jgi:hypothetical protein